MVHVLLACILLCCIPILSLLFDFSTSSDFVIAFVISPDGIELACRFQISSALGGMTLSELREVIGFSRITMLTVLVGGTRLKSRWIA